MPRIRAVRKSTQRRWCNWHGDQLRSFSCSKYDSEPSCSEPDSDGARRNRGVYRSAGAGAEHVGTDEYRNTGGCVQSHHPQYLFVPER